MSERFSSAQPLQLAEAMCPGSWSHSRSHADAQEIARATAGVSEAAPSGFTVSQLGEGSSRNLAPGGLTQQSQKKTLVAIELTLQIKSCA